MTENPRNQDFRIRIVALFDEFYSQRSALMQFLSDTAEFIEEKTSRRADLVQHFVDGARVHPSERTPPKAGMVVLKLSREEYDEVISGMRRFHKATTAYPGMMYNMAYIYLVALIDAFISDVLTAILNHRPELLRSKQKQMSYQRILELASTGDIVDFMAQGEVMEFAYKSIGDQLDYLKNKVGLELNGSSSDVEQLAVIWWKRNVLVHGNGLVTSTSLDRITNSAHQLGDRIVITPVDWEHADDQVSSLALSIRQAALKKFDGPSDELNHPYRGSLL